MKLSSLPHSQFEFIRFRNEKFFPSRLIERKHRTHCIVRLAFNPFLRFRINRRVNTELSTRVMKPPVYWYAYQLRGKSRSNFSLPHCLRRQAGFNFLLSSPFSNRASFQGAIPAFPPSFLSSFSPLFFFFLLEKKSEEEDCRTRRKSKVRQHTHTHTLSCKWSRNTFASTRRFRSFKGRSKDVRDETSRRSFQWKYIYSCTSCKVATSFSSLISTRVQREAGRSHTLTRNVNNVSSNGCLPRSILTTVRGSSTFVRS